MSDARLNSVHLDFPRREEFRRAREVLLEGRGMHTIAAERQDGGFGGGGGSQTLLHGPHHRLPDNAEHWLMDKEGVYPLKTGVNTIGRLPDNDVVIQGAYVSRRHCAVLVHSGSGCELYDIASKNGTFVNGAKLTKPTHLNPGDEIRMCDRTFIFMSRKAAPERPDAAQDTMRAE
jgi:hypothetical protein